MPHIMRHESKEGTRRRSKSKRYKKHATKCCHLQSSQGVEALPANKPHHTECECLIKWSSLGENDKIKLYTNLFLRGDAIASTMNGQRGDCTWHVGGITHAATTLEQEECVKAFKDLDGGLVDGDHDGAPIARNILH